MHLADFLRERLLLTGTHIGCEHGICGACTVVIDGEIARSCITYAVQCDGTEITTIEGFAEDPLMARLRAAFTTDHALQCGFCTPGMIIAARDLIRRKGRLDRQQIREEMSGNLCRCTGYMGLVAAIGRVMAEGRRSSGPAASRSRGSGRRRARARLPSPQGARGDAAGRGPAEAAGEGLRPDAQALLDDISEEGLTALAESFAVPHPPERVWEVLSDVRTVAGCLPGARLAGQDGDRISGEMRLKLGPMSPRFAGKGRISRDDRSRRARIVGQARDAASASRARARIDYAVVDDRRWRHAGRGRDRLRLERHAGPVQPRARSPPISSGASPRPSPRTWKRPSPATVTSRRRGTRTTAP